MALKNKSLILYNYQVGSSNNAIDFVAVSLGPTLFATIPFGYYSLTSLLTAIALAMGKADTAHIYTVTADRTISSGAQNRITISTSGTYLDLLFVTGPRSASTMAGLIGFSGDQTGATTYTGTVTTGTSLIPALIGYNFTPPTLYNQIQGSVNISASGTKEAIVYQIQKFMKVQFKYETESNAINNWNPWWQWAIQQRPFDFTPDYTLAPTTFYQVTLEKTSQDSKGIGFLMPEMLPKFPFLYETGMIEMRVVQ
jgi:hypothetical protein